MKHPRGDFEMQQHLRVGRVFLIHVKSVCHLYVPKLWQRQLRYEAPGVFCDLGPFCH